jgi:hypothetical protein
MKKSFPPVTICSGLLYLTIDHPTEYVAEGKMATMLKVSVSRWGYITAIVFDRNERVKSHAYNKVIMAHTIFSQNLYHKKYRLYQCITTLLKLFLWDSLMLQNLVPSPNSERDSTMPCAVNPVFKSVYRSLFRDQSFGLPYLFFYKNWFLCFKSEINSFGIWTHYASALPCQLLQRQNPKSLTGG